MKRKLNFQPEIDCGNKTCDDCHHRRRRGVDWVDNNYCNLFEEFLAKHKDSLLNKERCQKCLDFETKES